MLDLAPLFCLLSWTKQQCITYTGGPCEQQLQMGIARTCQNGLRVQALLLTGSSVIQATNGETGCRVIRPMLQNSELVHACK